MKYPLYIILYSVFFMSDLMRNSCLKLVPKRMVVLSLKKRIYKHCELCNCQVLIFHFDCENLGAISEDQVLSMFLCTCVFIP